MQWSYIYILQVLITLKIATLKYIDALDRYRLFRFTLLNIKLTIAKLLQQNMKHPSMKRKLTVQCVVTIHAMDPYSNYLVYTTKHNINFGELWRNYYHTQSRNSTNSCLLMLTLVLNIFDCLPSSKLILIHDSYQHLD